MQAGDRIVDEMGLAVPCWKRVGSSSALQPHFLLYLIEPDMFPVGTFS